MTDHLRIPKRACGPKGPSVLPQCLERFQALQQDVTEIKADVKHLRRTLTDDPNESIAAVVNRHKGYWKLFAILGTLLALAGTIAGTIYAAIR
ncbi:MAG: hypothetical protein AMJ81_09255 [Phycisphaerae bacterium SM23_33]|nr:MAG: hypothetical protein AMJ81_09255 [Phycisphaerae bacterium SM23_33]